MNPVSTNAFVLRRTNFQDADRILTMLTESDGLVSAIAKGARKQKSKLAGGIEPFTRNSVTIVKGKSSLWTVRSARGEALYGNIITDPSRLDFAFEIMKTITKMVEDGEGSALYDPFHHFLTALNTPEINTDLITIWINTQLASFLGNPVNLTEDTDGNALRKEGKYRFVNNEGTFAPSNGTEDCTSAEIQLWRLAHKLSITGLCKVANAADAAYKLAPITTSFRRFLTD